MKKHKYISINRRYRKYIYNLQENVEDIFFNYDIDYLYSYTELIYNTGEYDIRCYFMMDCDYKIYI